MTARATIFSYLFCAHHANRFALEEMVNELGNEGAAEKRYKMTQLHVSIWSHTVKACKNKPGWLSTDTGSQADSRHIKYTK